MQIHNRPFIGRKKELNQLRLENWRNKAELICMYGRRRVGKTALIEEAFRGCRLLKFEGIEGASKTAQIQNFNLALQSYFPDDSPKAAAQNKWPNQWEQALQRLTQLLKKNKIYSEKKVVFFDEFQWMAGERTELVSIFKKVWDQEFSHIPHCKFVLCGSVSSFMVKKVIRSKALYGRVDTELRLEPFSISEISDFFDNKRPNHEVFDIAMTLGGIPQYLLELNPLHSFSQNLHNQAFSPNGYFYREFGRLFISHFGKNPIYEKTLSALALKAASSEELARQLSIKTGGTFSSILEDLELAGFVERVTPINKSPAHAKLVRYRMHDEYLQFYFRFIETKRREIQNSTVKLGGYHLQKYFEQWRGYAFERLCRKNSKYIAEHLGFSGIEYAVGSWFQGKNSKNSKLAGAQIDLLFERSDRVLTVCELKVNAPRDIPKMFAALQQRVTQLRTAYEKKMAIQTVFISLEPLSPQQRTKLCRSFDLVFDAAELFGV